VTIGFSGTESIVGRVDFFLMQNMGIFVPSLLGYQT
jgi:hypothetical protein